MSDGMSGICGREELLAGLIHEGALSAEECRVVEKHLSGCPKCQASLEALRGAGRALRDAAPHLAVSAATLDASRSRAYQAVVSAMDAKHDEGVRDPRTIRMPSRARGARLLAFVLAAAAGLLVAVMFLAPERASRSTRPELAKAPSLDEPAAMREDEREADVARGSAPQMRAAPRPAPARLEKAKAPEQVVAADEGEAESAMRKEKALDALQRDESTRVEEELARVLRDAERERQEKNGFRRRPAGERRPAEAAPEPAPPSKADVEESRSKEADRPRDAKAPGAKAEVKDEAEKKAANAPAEAAAGKTLPAGRTPPAPPAERAPAAPGRQAAAFELDVEAAWVFRPRGEAARVLVLRRDGSVSFGPATEGQAASCRLDGVARLGSSELAGVARVASAATAPGDRAVLAVLRAEIRESGKRAGPEDEILRRLAREAVGKRDAKGKAEAEQAEARPQAR